MSANGTRFPCLKEEVFSRIFLAVRWIFYYTKVKIRLPLVGSGSELYDHQFRKNTGIPMAIKNRLSREYSKFQKLGGTVRGLCKTLNETYGFSLNVDTLVWYKKS